MSGTSPLRIRVVPASASSGTACSAAWPVPSCGSWRAKATPGARGCGLDGVGTMAGDDDDAARPELRCGIAEHAAIGLAAQAVEHLRQPGAHPRALARRHDHDVQSPVRRPPSLPLCCELRLSRRSAACSSSSAAAARCAWATGRRSPSPSAGSTATPTSTMPSRCVCARGCDPGSPGTVAPSSTDYADLLTRVDTAIRADTTPERVCGWWDEARGHIDAALGQAAPTIAEVGGMLKPAQLDHIQRQYAKSNREYRDDFLQEDPVRRAREAAKRVVSRAESLYGSLDDAQRARIAPVAARFAVRCRGVVRGAPAAPAGCRCSCCAVCRASPTPTPGSPRCGHGCGGIDRSPREAYRRYAERLVKANCRLAADLHNITTPTQRESASKRCAAGSPTCARSPPTAAAERCGRPARQGPIWTEMRVRLRGGAREVAHRRPEHGRQGRGDHRRQAVAGGAGLVERLAAAPVADEQRDFAFVAVVEAAARTVAPSRSEEDPAAAGVVRERPVEARPPPERVVERRTIGLR